MRKIIFSIAVFGSLISLYTHHAFAIDPANLIKVSPGKNTKCIEYYTIKGELYCSTTAQQTESLDPNLKQYEKMRILFDDRSWQIAWGKNEPNITTIEYIPEGDDIQQWNELITSQTFPGLQETVTPKQFAQAFIDKLNTSGYRPLVTFYEDTPDRVIFEFKIHEPRNQTQNELQMITKDANNLYVLHYVIKKADMGTKRKKQWLHNFKNSLPMTQEGNIKK